MRRPAFTLIELLVVVAIIALLVGIMVPSLSHARALAKVRVCANNLRNIGHGVVLYAHANHEEIPHGPAGNCAFGMPFSDMATSQIWLGIDPMLPPGGPSKQYVGSGLLIKNKSASPQEFYCPADETEDETDDQQKIGTDENAYSSYLYRQLDAVPAGSRHGRIGDLGDNQCKYPNGSKTQVQVQALAMDVSSYGQGPMQHLTHAGLTVNVLYQDTSVRDQKNLMVKETGVAPRTDPQELPDDRIFSLYMDRAFGPDSYLAKRINDVLIRADFSYQHNPVEAPQGP